MDSAPDTPLASATRALVRAVRDVAPTATRPILIAIDGRSGSGKSTLTAQVHAPLQASVIPADDFFAAHVTDAEWDASSPRSRAEAALDWRRLRAEALEPLLAGRPARWHAFDFAAGARPDGTYRMQLNAVERAPAPVILLDGAYSSRSELSDLIDYTVLVDAPASIRRRRLAGREEPDVLAAWHARWDEAEDYYFTHVRPAPSFDLIVWLGGESENEL